MGRVTCAINKPLLTHMVEAEKLECHLQSCFLSCSHKSACELSVSYTHNLQIGKNIHTDESKNQSGPPLNNVVWKEINSGACVILVSLWSSKIILNVRRNTYPIFWQY